MNVAIDRVRFESLAERCGLNDRALGSVLGVDQSTVWRLRHGKIAKISGYIQILETHLGLSPNETDVNEEALVRDLTDLARHSPNLRNALIALQRIMQNRA